MVLLDLAFLKDIVSSVASGLVFLIVISMVRIEFWLYPAVFIFLVLLGIRTL